MTRTITVKGVGKASAKPDFVVLRLTLTAKDMQYEKAMELAAGQIHELNGLLCGVGFEKDDLKTTDFTVSTDYDRSISHRPVFRGYEVEHDLRLGFDFDSVKLAQTLSAVSAAASHPYISVDFTVKDASAINEEMLRFATANAKRKAQILCEASGVKLGELVNIDYNWGELDICSHTRYDYCRDYIAQPCRSVDITPEDIDVSDTATFVWSIS